MAQEKLTLDKMRELIVYLEPVMDCFDGSFMELTLEAVDLCKRLERTFNSDISSVEALLLAALVNRLRFHMRNVEREIATGPPGAFGYDGEVSGVVTARGQFANLDWHKRDK